MNDVWMTAKKMYDTHGTGATFRDMWDIALSRKEAYLLWQAYCIVCRAQRKHAKG